MHTTALFVKFRCRISCFYLTVFGPLSLVEKNTFVRGDIN